MNGMSNFMKYIISDLNCNELMNKNNELVNKNNELVNKNNELVNKNKILEEDKETLKNDTKDLKYKLNGIQNSQDEIYKKYADLIIKISRCKC